jgi:ubiquinone/menaquinone biosynthesis C-methylase UbiE
MGVSVTVLDIDPDLEPDIQASVENMPLKENAFDVSVCCQVLEHLPFERFTVALKEIRRVTRSHLVLSLPDNNRFFNFKLQLGSFNNALQGSIPRLRPKPIGKSRYDQMGHFWEIGFRGYGLSKVKTVISDSGWRLLEHRRVPDLAWHSFFYCSAL